MQIEYSPDVAFTSQPMSSHDDMQAEVISSLTYPEADIGQITYSPGPLFKLTKWESLSMALNDPKKN
jgi:hypothetical protein